MIIIIDFILFFDLLHRMQDIVHENKTRNKPSWIWIVGTDNGNLNMVGGMRGCGIADAFIRMRLLECVIFRGPHIINNYIDV